MPVVIEVHAVNVLGHRRLRLRCETLDFRAHLLLVRRGNMPLDHPWKLGDTWLVLRTLRCGPLQLGTRLW